MKDSPDPPKAPDPAEVTRAQAEANRVSMVTPFGNVLYLTPSGTPTMSSTLRGTAAPPSPVPQFIPFTGRGEEQGTMVPNPAWSPGAVTQAPEAASQRGGFATPSLPGMNLPEGFGLESPSVAFLDLPPEVLETIQAQQRTGRTMADLSTGFAKRLEGLPAFEMPDFSADAEKVERATMDRLTGLLDPRFERQARALEQRLANRGTPVGTEIYADEMDLFRRSRNEAELAAGLEAILAGRREHSRLTDLSFRERAQPFSELAAILRGVPIPQPGAVPGIQPPRLDVTGPIQQQYAGELAAFNAGEANRQATLGGLFDLGSAGISAYAISKLGPAAALMSSRDAKHVGAELDGAEVLEGLKGLRIHRWRYREDAAPEDQREHVGPMAEDMAETFGIGNGTTISIIDAIGLLLLAVKALAQKVDAMQPPSTNPMASILKGA